MSIGVHILSKQINENEYIAFDPMSKTVLIINRQEKNIIEKFQKGLPLSESEKYILKDILDFLTEKRENVSKQQFPPDGSPNMMVLMVSQLCNIKCKYCYAHSGTYNTPGIMKEGIGKRALDIASDLGVTSIQFYGGEPLTNFELISKLVEYGDKQGYSFKYGIITNGTLMDKEIGNFLKQHDFEVTISIDGPREINDLNRVYPTGKGTHDDILKAVDLLNELEVPLALEITYAP
ncbi:radical SAM protein [Thermococcus sp. M36]|uniref:radical SAM protein n=1 Tax=Thermococcus sp. M36 TaxID=1638261 RepID=UPI00143B0E7B|nr:radical SAM protein [Thermococcus sp. M36]